ncbi:MAG TPA: amino acid ABC transporter substrate-binding protein [Vicinamibacteria bacterium]|jgi:branched-chain amino acid transport system substrate-binding protein|nr:amino acid ABC transporter substrate-binding protein [Vicinamibacteria bacterium]
MPSKPKSVSAPLLLAALCAFSGASPAGGAPEDQTIRIGAVLPVTGKESKIGSAYKQATEFAIREINDGGGIDLGARKFKVDLTLLDDTSDPAKSAQLVEQLITQKVHAVIGGYGSQLVQAQSVMPERYGVPFLAGGAGARSIYGRSKWVFGTLSPVDVLASTQMDFLDALVGAGRLRKPVKIALVTENTEHGKDYAQGVQDFIRAHPGEFVVALEESFELYTPDFKPLLSRVAGARADVLMADAHLEDYIAMHRAYTQMGLYHQMVTYGARGADAAARKALGSATDYVFASGWWSDLLPYPQVKAFNARWKSATGSDPQWYHATAYETVRALAAAIHKAGGLSPDAIRNGLATVELKDSILPGGVLKFSASGQAILPFVVTQNKPGDKVDIVWPKESKTGEAVGPIPRS